MNILNLASTTTEMENSLEWLEDRFQIAGESIRKLEDKKKFSNLKNREKNE